MNTSSFKAYTPGQTIGFIGSRVEVRKSRHGFVVAALIPPPSSDDMYETIEHGVTWLHQADAERFAARLRAGDASDGKVGQARWVACLDYWTWTPSVCSPFSYMHEVQTFGLPLAA